MANMLLAEATGFAAWAKSAGEFFTGFRGIYVAEIAALFLMFTFVSRMLKENDATRMMIAYWAMIVIVGVLSYAVDFLDAQFYLFEGQSAEAGFAERRKDRRGYFHAADRGYFLPESAFARRRHDFKGA